MRRAEMSIASFPPSNNIKDPSLIFYLDTRSPSFAPSKVKSFLCKIRHLHRTDIGNQKFGVRERVFYETSWEKVFLRWRKNCSRRRGWQAKTSLPTLSTTLWLVGLRRKTSDEF